MRILSFILVTFAFLFFAGILSAAPDCSPTGKDKDSIECRFGTIAAPSPLAGFLAKDPTGAGAISQFLSNFIILIFSVAGIVLILMIVWGAFDWMISEGDKEKVAAARSKIINAIIGIILFALAFAIIQVLGTFIGFKFFKGP